MKYVGSKNRIAKYILPIILKDRKEDQWYVEPFCGGCNTIDKVTGNRIASDSHNELIAMFKELQKGWIPPKSVSEEEYRTIRRLIAKDNFDYLKGYVGFNLSFSGKWWGGYARDGMGRRNYGIEAFNNVMKQVPFIKDIVFQNTLYSQLLIPDNSIIYCDPPYRSTTGYKDSIDYEEFYQWCRDMKAKGHQIFVSEYAMPADFICLWSKEQITTLSCNVDSSRRAIEKLFTL